MSDQFTSYFSLGLLIFLFIIIVLIFRNPLLFRYALRNTLRYKRVGILILLSSVITPILISSSLIVNDSLSKSSSKYINSKLGNSIGVIYSRDQKDVWSSDRANQIFSRVNSEYNNFLPIFYKSIDINSNEKRLENVIITSFNKDSAAVYNTELLQFKNDLDIKTNQAVISTSLAKDLDINIGDEISGNNKTLNVIKIIDDNGLIGFNFPLASKNKVPYGSIYVSPDYFEEYKGKDIYNALLLKRNYIYEAQALERATQEVLSNYDRNLIFEELRSDLKARSSGGNSSLNFGQILLFVNILAIVSSIILTLYLYYFLYIKRSKEIELLNSLGHKKSFISKLVVFEGFIYSSIASMIGLLISIPFSKILFQTVTNIIIRSIPDLDFKPNFEFILNPSSMIYALAGSFFVIFFSTIFLSSIVSNIKSKYSRSSDLTTNKVVLLIIVGLFSVTTLYFSTTGRFSSKELSTLGIYVSLTLIALASAYITKFFWDSRKIFTTTSIFLILINIAVMFVEPYKSLWRQIPYLLILNSLILLLSIGCLAIYNLDIFAKPFKLILSKFSRVNQIINLGIRSNGENKFVSITILSIFSVLILFISLISIARSEVNKIVREVDTNFQVLITDKYDSSNVKNSLNDKNIRGFQSALTINFGSAVLSDYKYKDFQNFSEDNSFGFEKENPYSSAVVTIDNQFFDKDLEFESNKSKDDIEKEFLGSNKYIILGKNFSKESKGINLHPDLKVGNEIELTLSGDIKIKRKVLALIKDTKSAVSNSISNTENQGILLSQNDYEELKKENSLYFSTVHGIQTAKADPIVLKSDVLKLFKETSSIPNLTFTDEVVDKNTKFLNDLINLGVFFGTLSLFIAILILTLTLRTQYFENRSQNRYLTLTGFTSTSLNIIYIIRGISLILLSIVLGYGMSLFCSHFFYKFVLPEEKLYVQTKDLFLIYISLIIFTFISQLLSFNKFTNKDYGK